jgi:hypothetical protein
MDEDAGTATHQAAAELECFLGCMVNAPCCCDRDHDCIALCEILLTKVSLWHLQSMLDLYGAGRWVCCVVLVGCGVLLLRGAGVGSCDELWETGLWRVGQLRIYVYLGRIGTVSRPSVNWITRLCAVQYW